MEREGEGERDREGERKREGERVYVREGGREREKKGREMTYIHQDYSPY